MNLEEAENCISLLDEGGIEYQPIVEQEFDGDFNLLMSCVEDNIVLNEGGEEEINWYTVGIDYRLITGHSPGGKDGI